MFNQYPYLNLNDLNLDYLLNLIKSLENEISSFVSLNALKYADPIQWEIDRQYEKNTIVIDSRSGVAYISVQPVPTGVAIDNTDYWTEVFDLGALIEKQAKNFTNRFEDETVTAATFESVPNDWLVWGDVLYRVISQIDIGEQYVVGVNIERLTMEEIIGHIEDLTTPRTNNIVSAINSVNERIIGKIVDMTYLGLPTDGTSDCTTIFENIVDNDPTTIYYIPKGYYVFNSAPTLGSYNNMVTILIDMDATNSYVTSNTAPFYANWSFLDHSKINVIYNSLHSFTVGATNFIDYELISSGAKAAYATITSISPIGFIGILGGSDTKNLNGSAGYPIGVMGMAMANDDTNTNAASACAFYGEVYRDANTQGASIGIEIDHKIDTPCQNITPNSTASPGLNYSTAIQLSNGMTENTHEALSCGIYFGNNGGTFNKGLVVNKDAITPTIVGREAVVLPEDNLIDWYGSNDKPCVEMLGGVNNNEGLLTIALIDSSDNINGKHITLETMLGVLKCKCISVASDTYAAASPFAIDLTTYLDSGYGLNAILMLQYPVADPTPYNLVVSTIVPESNSIAGYNFGASYTGDLNIVVLEYKNT